MKEEFEQFSAFSTILWLQQKRKPYWFIAELLLPLLFSVTVLILNGTVSRVDREDTIFKNIPIYGNALDLVTPVDGVPLISTMLYYDTLYYAPKTELTEKLMAKVENDYVWDKIKVGPLIRYFGLKAEDLESKSVKQFCNSNPINLEVVKQLCDNIRWYTFTVAGFESEADLVNFAVDPHTTNRYIGAVIFSDTHSEQKWKYKLRFRYYHRNLLPEHFKGILGDWQTDRTKRSGLDPTLLPYPNLTDGGVPAYWREMFLSVQKAIDNSITWQIAKQEKTSFGSMQTVLQRFPFPEHQTHPIFSYAPMLLPLIIMLSFLISILSVTRCIAIDQETLVKDYMHVMGLSHFAYWLAYFMMNFLKLIFPIIMITIVLSILFSNSNPVILALIVLLYALNALWFALAIASAFNRGAVAMLVAAVLWFILYLPSLYFQQKTDHTRMEKMFGCILLNNCLTLIIQLLVSAEMQGSGMTWSNVSSQYGGITLAYLLAMLLVGMVIWILIFFLFVLGRNFKIFCKSDKKVFEYKSKEAFVDKFGKVPISIFVKNLSVVVGNCKTQTVAVKDVTFDAHEGGITVLLGCNGSGKTTLLSTLAGIHRVTDGQIKVGESDMTKLGSTGRKQFSYCPQYNPLFDIISIKEHIAFYAKVKGHDAEIQKYYPVLHRLQLWHIRFNYAKTLSGGMKRKLSLAIALCSNSQIVLLDEPTSGLDVEIRREVQGLLLQEKRNRLILMSSHYLEEADTLGDQVLLMHRGRIIDKGNSRMLKKKFGEYLNLYLTLQEGFREAHIREIANLIKKYCPEFAIMGCEGRCLHIQLDTLRISWETLAEICFQLDHVRLILKISNIRAAITTLENVFKKQNNQSASLVPEEVENPELLNNLKSNHPLDTLPLYCQQVGITIYKRMLTFWRQKWLLFSQTLIPILVIIIGIIVNNSNRRYVAEPEKLNLALLAPYTDSEAFIHIDEKPLDFSKKVFDKLDLILSSFGLTVTKYKYQKTVPVLLHESRHEGSWNFMNSHYFSSEIQNSTLVMFFNNFAPHSISTSLNLASNSILKASFGENYEITAINHPLPPQFLVYFLFGEEFVMALCLSLGTLIFMSIFVASLTHERVSGAKHLQLFSGLHKTAYWFGTFFFDGLFTTLVNLVLILALFLGRVYFLADKYSWFHSFSLLQLHAWAILPLIYLKSLIFESASGALAKTLILNLVLSLVPTCGVAGLIALSYEEGQEHLAPLERNVSNILTYIIPHFTFTKSIMTYYTNRLTIDQCDRLNSSCSQIGSSFANTRNFTQWDPPGVGRYMLILAIQGVVLWLLLGIFESLFIDQIVYTCNSGSDRLFENTYDPNNEASPVLTANKVLATYKNNIPTLRELDLTMRKGDCICLVGKNGAGKTTLFKVLTGIKTPIGGMVKLFGRDPKWEMHELNHEAGYCPQSDSLFERLTVIENLRIYAKIRAIPPRHAGTVINELVVAFGLQEHALKQTRNLSGGNRRKVSLAVSVIGLPKILLLDEPTTGIDPAGRLSIGSLLNKIRQHHSALLISSHSTDLMEAVGTEIAVQEHGQIVARHSVETIAENRTGFRLKVVTACENGANNVDKTVQAMFKSCQCKSSASPNALYYVISSESGATWSSLLNMMKSLQIHEKLHDFEISEVYFDDLVPSY